LTLCGALREARIKVWTERSKASVSPARGDGRLLEPEEAFNMLW
jgi:hypothetical protein